MHSIIDIESIEKKKKTKIIVIIIIRRGKKLRDFVWKILIGISEGRSGERDHAFLGILWGPLSLCHHHH